MVKAAGLRPIGVGLDPGNERHTNDSRQQHGGTAGAAEASAWRY